MRGFCVAGAFHPQSTSSNVMEGKRSLSHMELATSSFTSHSGQRSRLQGSVRDTNFQQTVHVNIAEAQL